MEYSKRIFEYYIIFIKKRKKHKTFAYLSKILSNITIIFTDDNYLNIKNANKLKNIPKFNINNLIIFYIFCLIINQKRLKYKNIFIIMEIEDSLTYQINYDFYKDYLDDDIFKLIFDQRKLYIKNKFCLKCSDEELIKEYFVEIFSWTVLSNDILFKINRLIDYHVPNGILIDPCSGNSFHTFLFDHFCKRQVVTIDVQPESNAWVKTICCDGLDYLKKLDNHQDKILLLSWIDLTDNELSYNLLKSFKGNLVISVGNYRPINSKKYLDELNTEYHLVKSIDCIMPWELLEEIRIYKKII